MTNELAAPVYLHYSTVDGNICDGTVALGCSFSNLTYNQWLHGSVLYYPLPGMDYQAIDSTYVNLYADYTLLKFVPEVNYWAAMSGWDFPAEVTIEDVYQGFNITGLFNPTVNQNIWLQIFNSGSNNVFTSPNVVFWQRYLALNFGLGGWFTKITPRTLIEGYDDPVLKKLSQTPLYLGGDMTVNPWISIDNNTPTKPMNAPISLNTGESDDTLTKQTMSWLG